jgi:hypothetical protein
MPRKASVNNSRELESLFIRLPNGELSKVGWLAINLKTAKTLGQSVPHAADECR